jgi:hypothetical protein
VTLVGLSVGIDPADPAQVRERLLEAVGDDLVEDTAAGVRRRERLVRDAWRSGRFPLPPRTARQLGAADLVDRLSAAWLAVLAQVASDPDSTQLLDEAESLGRRLRQAERALDAAGGPVITSYARADGCSRLRGVGVAHL